MRPLRIDAEFELAVEPIGGKFRLSAPARSTSSSIGTPIQGEDNFSGVRRIAFVNWCAAGRKPWATNAPHQTALYSITSPAQPRRCLRTADGLNTITLCDGISVASSGGRV